MFILSFCIIYILHIFDGIHSLWKYPIILVIAIGFIYFYIYIVTTYNSCLQLD